MRVNNYIKEKNITLSLLNRMCEYLFINEVLITSKISDEYIKLFDKTLNSKTFNKWHQSKIQFHKSIDFQNGNRLILLLNYNSHSNINQILGLRIINSLNYFINNLNRFSEHKKQINIILQSNKGILDKISELRNIKPFKKPELKSNSSSSEIDINVNLEVEIDPYENFHFGGLSGEEAHTAYWNCD